MADKQKIVSIVQGRCQNWNNDFMQAIEAALESIWAEMTERHEWWFMESAASIKIDLVANQASYTINRDDVGRILFIGDANRKKLIYYVDRQGFGSTVPADGATSSPSVCRVIGILGGKKIIMVTPTPSAANSVYLYYQESGSLGNISRMPDHFIKTTVHGIMSLIGPPEEKIRSINDAEREQISKIQYLSWWKSITQDEDKLYEAGLARLIRECPPAAWDRPVNRMDHLIDSRLDEVNSL